MAEYVIQRTDGRYVSKRQILFRPMQFTNSLKNAARFNNRSNARLYAQINLHNDFNLKQVK